MKAPQPPRLETRRTREFSAELQERARAWIPSWEVTENEGDFGRALLEIAARFNSEVAERLDRAGEKMRRGFLDWLAVRREAARPSRMPVVFKLIDAARDPVLASAPVRMQADAGGTPVVFETENDVRLIPGRLDTVVGADGLEDAFYLPPPGISDLKPLEPMPTQWQLKSFASAGANKLQLDPEIGLAENMLIRANGEEYKVIAVDKDLVTIDPPLANDLTESVPLTKVTTFSPFSGARNWQAHVLYLGDSELLNIEAAARIEVVGTTKLREGFTWEYWGKRAPEDQVGWQQLTFSENQISDGVALEKLKGAVEEIEIGGKNSRWLRAYTKKVEPDAVPITTDRFSIRVNAAGCNTKLPCPQDKPTESPVAEGMANTTPLVLDNVFFPLGKEPRQFDAFYLGSQEAFSKPGAEVQLCFEIADANFTVMSALRSGPAPNLTLAGVAAAGHLHLLAFDPTTGRLSAYPNREPLRPPSPGPLGAVVAEPLVTLDHRPPFRLPMWTTGNQFLVAATAGSSVWVWVENTNTPEQSGWESLGDVGPVNDTSAKIAGLVYLADAGAGLLFALRDSFLFVRDLDDPNATWQPVSAVDATDDPVSFTKISAVCVEGTDLTSGVLAEGLVGIGTDNVLYGVTFSGSPLVGACTELITDVATDIAPAAVRRADQRLVAVAVGLDQADRQVFAFLSDPGVANFQKDDDDVQDLEWREVIGESIDVNISGGQLVFVFCSKILTQLTGLSAWTPFDPPNPDALFNTIIPSRVGISSGAPTLLPQHVLVPTTANRVIVAPFDLSLRLSINNATVESVVITETAADKLVANDAVAYLIDDGGNPAFELENVNAGVEFRGQTFHALTNATISDVLLVYKQSSPSFEATIPDDNALDEMRIDDADITTGQLSILRIETDQSTELYRVDDFDPVTRIATLDRDLDHSDATQPFAYKVHDDSGAIIRPMLHLNPNTTGNWDAALLNSTSLLIEDAEPELQQGLAFQVDINGRPILVALAEAWTSLPPDPGQVDFLVDGSVGAWIVQLGDTSTNPELSWEYWNGAGWSKLNPVHDETLNFKRTGRVEFTVPEDLRSGDWAGKTNFWIRARLIGGDYGKEKVTVKTKDLGGGVTEQTVERSLEGIRPPSVLMLTIAYAICEEILPAFVLAQDSGTMRDQSDANRTPGAIVEAFIPLALTLGRLSKNIATPAVVATPEECPPECNCSGQHSAQTETQPETTATTLAGATPATGRSLFIGLAATPSDAPINVLLLVEERNHTAFAPIKVEALIANSFQPVVVNDTTRALGESGLLSMSFPVSPTPSELFGKTLTWLRLAPKQNATDEWIPVLRGAYLNAAWASATETLTRELIGSSDGAPNLRFRLARPPVLLDTLELRVREPLGDEEREALIKQDPKKVVNDPDLPGDWVLWTQVVDPNDEASDARVYALDEATGEIRFGDGTHGRIPPIGRDAIVAFSYSRTETGDSGSETVPGNTIGPRTTLNLVSPVETVETVTSADQAAGGAPAELDERVLRFGFARLRHRNRAVTARDIEDLALQSSPDIVQARAIVGRGFVKLVIVMRGDDPQPTAAQVRELRRFLLESAPAALSAPGALRIERPKVRRLQIALELRIETLDHAGALGEFVEQQLKSLFDTASGGIDKDGWPLGLDPTEDDIAFVLIDAPHLESIGDVKLREVVSDNEMRPWEGPVKANEIVMLADDLVRIEFETAEVLV